MYIQASGASVNAIKLAAACGKLKGPDILSRPISGDFFPDIDRLAHQQQAGGHAAALIHHLPDRQIAA
jgi:hypothetical protein